MRQTKGLMAILIILIAVVNINAVMALDGMPNSVLTNYSLSGEQIFPNINGWFNQNVTLNITSTNETGTNITQFINITGGVSGTFTYSSGGGSTTFTTLTNISVEGITTVEYYAIDASGNIEPEKNSTIKIDRTKPVINLVALNTTSPNTGNAILVTVNATDNFGVTSVTANGTALTNPSGNIWNGTIIASVGTHSVNVSASDAADNVVYNETQSYNANPPPDTTKPVITLLDSTPITIEVGSVYIDAGATALDNYDGDLTGSIVTVNHVDNTTVGTYSVTYNVNDSSNNAATEVTRTVNIVDTIAPYFINVPANRTVNATGILTYLNLSEETIQAIDNNPGCILKNTNNAPIGFPLGTTNIYSKRQRL
ncbi:MAG: DUF5011 domain-containing protein [Candidatus Methanoperedens sp.]|nr:DUF5011 domain-containing protein [Candidatus Methanoperedens sp.]